MNDRLAGMNVRKLIAVKLCETSPNELADALNISCSDVRRMMSVMVVKFLM